MGTRVFFFFFFILHCHVMPIREYWQNCHQLIVVLQLCTYFTQNTWNIKCIMRHNFCLWDTKRQQKLAPPKVIQGKLGINEIPGTRNFVCYIRYLVISVVNKQYKTKEIISLTRENSLLYQISSYRVSTVHMYAFTKFFEAQCCRWNAFYTYVTKIRVLASSGKFCFNTSWSWCG